MCVLVCVTACMSVSVCECVCVVFGFSTAVVLMNAPSLLKALLLSSISLLYGKWILILKQIDLEISSRI